jgi:hypothetical protein
MRVSRDVPPRAPLLFLGLCGLAIAVLIASGALTIATQTPHNARPVLGLSWIVLLLAIFSAIAGAWLAAFRQTASAVVLSITAAIAAIALTSGSFLLVAALAIALQSEPDPALYRVPSAVEAVRAAKALVPGAHIDRVLLVESLRNAVTTSTNDVTWHVQLEGASSQGARVYDICVDGVSGETYMVR